MYAVIASGGNNSRSRSRMSLRWNVSKVLPERKLHSMKFSRSEKVPRSGSAAPLVEGAKVEGEIVEHFRGPKLIAFKMKRRKGYRKRKGHRQELTKVKITSIA